MAKKLQRKDEKRTGSGWLEQKMCVNKLEITWLCGENREEGRAPQTRRCGIWHKAVRQKQRTWRMTSQRQLRKFKDWTGQKASVPPGAGWNGKMVTVRELVQV